MTAIRFIPAESIVMYLLRRSECRIAALLTLLAVLLPRWAAAEPIDVQHPEGAVHGFLVLRTMAGSALADGDLIQTTRGSTVTSRLVFRFKDGSIHDETAVFTERQQFRLVRDHLVQNGPAFPQSLDMAIDTATGTVVVRSGKGGETKTESEHLDLHADLANGLILTLLKNIGHETASPRLPFVVATPTPQLVTLQVGTAGRDRFSTGGTVRTATHYVVKVKIGGLKGLLASLLGKQPPDSHVWILGGAAPAFIKAEQPLYAGGPVWRIELVSPAGPKNVPASPQ
jgi:hypothetical protein